MIRKYHTIAQFKNQTSRLFISYEHQKYRVFAIEQTSESQELNDVSFSSKEKLAFVLGNEVKGVEQAVIDVCDGSIEIPQFGSKHSLNISVCAGVVIWHVFSNTYIENLEQP
ncbi:MAG: hypothetical protein LC664_09025 [Flavobacteriales bacterium]|nr:hypothetical protein [Flavobacteriales bacterium]